MTKLLAIAIGFDETKQTYFANIHSLTDEQMLNVQSMSASKVLKEIDRAARAKLKQIKNFPLDEPGRILGPNGVVATETKLTVVGGQ